MSAPMPVEGAPNAFFVPHDLKAPLGGASAGALAGLTAGVKDMYDIAGERAGGGNPDWLAAQRPASSHAAMVEKILAAGATIVPIYTTLLPHQFAYMLKDSGTRVLSVSDTKILSDFVFDNRFTSAHVPRKNGAFDSLYYLIFFGDWLDVLQNISSHGFPLQES